MDNAAEFEVAIRGPGAYRLAQAALDLMLTHKVWPTPLNYELWLNCAGNPRSALAHEIERLIAEGEVFTEVACEALAAAYLPKVKLNDQICDAGDQLSRELDTVSKAIQASVKTGTVYGVTLAHASSELDQGSGDPEAIRALVARLSAATRQVAKETLMLQQQLKESTSEVRALRDHLAQVRRDATTDALTNLANRKAFDTELSHIHAVSCQSGADMSLAVIDIDHFKRFNDTWGHQTGDQVLRFVASVLARVGAAPRVAARYGGEEFALIFPGESADKVFGMLEDVLKEIGSRSLRRRSTNEELGVITVSAGVAQLRRGETATMLLERADMALYVSKNAGRNRVTNAEKTEGAAAA